VSSPDVEPCGDDAEWDDSLDETLEEDPDDDEELEVTPKSVVDILGFDPKEFSEDGDT
jgi:hypothetical protein